MNAGGAAPSTLRARLLDHQLAALSAGLAVGAAIGAIAAAGFLRLPLSGLVVATLGRRLAFASLLASGAASLAPLALAPAALLLGMREQRSAGRFAPRLMRSYLGVAAAGALFLAGFFEIAFDLTRRPASARGLALVTALLALCTAIAWTAIRGRRRVAPARRRAWIPLTLWALAAVAALGLGRSLASDAAPAAAAAMADDRETTPSRSARGADRTRPDVLLISIDTLRADHLGSYGYGRATSPHLDALAARSTRFAEMRSAAPWTLPAHASMLTGLYPATHGAQFFSNFSFLRGGLSARLDERFPTLAVRLADAGYATAAFTSTTWLTSEFGVVRGFDLVDESTSRPAEESVDHLLRWWRTAGSRDGKRSPRFALLHFFDVHDYRAPDGFDAGFDEAGYRGRLVGDAKRLMRNAYDAIDEADLRYGIAQYDSALRYVDGEIGRLVVELERGGTFDDTLIVVTSDHGEEFWEHGGTGHGFTLYDEQLRVPLLIKLPASAPAGVATSREAVSTVDLAPTILDYVGLPGQPAEGLSLREALEGRALPRRVLFAEATYFFNSAAVIGGGLKLIEHRVPPLGLFDPRLLLANVRSFYKFRPPEVFDVGTDAYERRGLEPGRGAGLQPALAAHLRRGALHAPSVLRLDPATREELEALGYVD